MCDIWGHAVAQLIEALRYKPEDRGFDSNDVIDYVKDCVSDVILPIALCPQGRLSL